MDPPKNPDPPVKLNDAEIKPVISVSNEKIKAKPAHVGAINGNLVNETFAAPSGESYHGDLDGREMTSSHNYRFAEAEELLWPKAADFGGHPSSPTSQDIAIKQVISESTYLFPKETALEDDRPPSPLNERKPAHQSSTIAVRAEEDRWPSSPEVKKSEMSRQKAKSWTQEMDDPQWTEAMVDALSWESSSPLRWTERQRFRRGKMEVISDSAYPLGAGVDGDDEEGPEGANAGVIREPAYYSEGDEEDVGMQGMMRESYRSSGRARAKLSRVVEESESFARREFGEEALNNAGSASHAANVARPSKFIYAAVHVSYQHSLLNSKLADMQEAAAAGGGGLRRRGFMNSRSAPAGTATRTGSAFGLFRRGGSEGSGFRVGRHQTVYRRRPVGVKPRSLASTLLWPLVKIRDGYVGCMMGIDGTADLSVLAQGGSYASAARYFPDIPLSKADSRNYG